MLTLTLVTLLAAPVHVEVLGFAVEVKGDVVEVVRVEADSPAAKAGLVTGVQFDKAPSSPVYRFARGPLAQLSPRDLQDALTPSWGEPLLIRGTLEGKSRTYAMARTDPEPKERFAELPLPAEKLKRLSVMETARYYAALSTFMSARMQTSRSRQAPLSLSATPVAELSPAGVEANDQLAATPQWLYLEDRLSFSCERSPMRRIELVGPSPVTKLAASSSDSALQGGSVPVELPLWRVKDAQAACKEGLTSLPSVMLVGILGCEGAPDISVELSLPLALRCDQPAPRERYHLDALRVRSPETVLVGSKAPLELEVWWRKLKPTPVLVTVVELDARGAVTRRLTTAPPPNPGDEGDSTRVALAIDTGKERELQLALEVKFPDGTIDLSTAQKLRVITRERDQAEARDFDARSAALEDVLKRLRSKFPDACQRPDAAVAWLREQPGVDIATNHGGHNLSFSVGGLPMIYDCHR